MIRHKSLLLSCFIENSPQAIPLATSILKTTVQDIEDLQIELLEFTIKTEVEEAAEVVLSGNPDSIGCSLYIWNYPFFQKLIQHIRQQNPEILVYCGGPEATASPEKINESNLFDYIIPGEGEIPFRRLMISLLDQSEDIPTGILTREHQTSLSDKPSPFLNGVLPVENYAGVVWELSRGCPFNCAFCCESRGISGVRYFDMERIAAELDLFESEGVDQVFVLDPTFNINKKRALEILDLIEEKTPYIHYTIEIRAELLDEELAEAFSRIHCSLQIGLQSCHKKVLKHLNRDIDMEKFSSKIALLNQKGVSFGLDLIMGLPGDSMTGFQESLNYAIGLIPNHLDIFRLSVFPGTELFDRSKDFELNFLQEPPYSLISSPDFTEDELKVLEGYSQAVDGFYNKGKAAPWLLPLLDLLNMEASQLFRKFQEFKGQKGSAILDRQIAFIQSLLTRDDQDSSLAAVMDLVLYHHLYSQCLNAAPLAMTESTINNRQTPYRKSDNIKQGIFSFDVTLYYELGMFDISAFINQFDREVSYGFFFNIDGNVQLMSLSRELYMYLQALDGQKTEEQIAKLIKCEAGELSEFSDFLVETGLIIPAR